MSSKKYWTEDDYRLKDVNGIALINIYFTYSYTIMVINIWKVLYVKLV